MLRPRTRAVPVFEPPRPVRRRRGPATGLAVALGLVLVTALWVRARPSEAALAAGAEGSASTEASTPRSPAPAPTASVATPAPRPAPAAVRDDVLERRIGSAIASAVAEASKRSRGKVDGSNVAVAVHARPLDGRGEWVAVQPDLAMRPASNLKLVTAAAALVLLGPDGSFETRFEALGEVAGGRLAGDLVARAGADPVYVRDGDGSIGYWVDRLAADLRRAGIERVDGALVLDEGTFRAPAPGPSWPPEQEYWRDYCALSGGFSANAGCLSAIVRPRAVGARADVLVHPLHHGLEPRGEVLTVAARSPLKVAVEARSGRVTVRGEIPADVTPSYDARFACPDPVELFGSAVVGALAERGVRVTGGWRRERGLPAGRPVATVRSAVADTLVPILTDSDNAVADQLFLATALAVTGEGTREGGHAATARALEALGVPSAGLVQVDGSGLSRDDRTSARQLTALLAAVLGGDPSLAEPFRAALPVAGESAKLSSRMADGPARGRVRAKTGFIAGTSGFSGALETLGGRRMAFAILVAYPSVDGLNTHCWKPMQDEICELLVTSDDG